MSVTTGDPAQSVVATGRMKTLGEAGLLDGSDCVVATRVSRLVGEDPAGDAALALAFAIRAVREGSTALSLESVSELRVAQDDEAESEPVDPVSAGSVVDLPDPDTWSRELASSALVAEGILHVELGLVYLDRYHSDECLIADRLRARRSAEVARVDPSAIENALQTGELNDAQAAAVRHVAEHATTVLTGGPGMGKTHTIGWVLRALRAGTRTELRVGLAAPTGKAAARMNESLREILGDDAELGRAVTLHRLLGSKPDTGQRFRHNALDPLPQDVVVVDEASMVSLSLMARLLEALPPATRLLLVGDPDQLASVEAGSVLADLVDGLEGDGSVVRLTEEHRLTEGGARLARAFRAGDAGAVLTAFDAGADGIELLETGEPTLDLIPGVVEHAVTLRELALRGDAVGALAHLGESRFLCAHRTGPYGTRHWNRLIERALAEHAPEVAIQPMYVGRPILVTRNDYGLGLSNGDTGVVIHTEDGPMAAIETGAGMMQLSPWRLSDIETMHAMTVHKAQGSQAAEVTVLVPPAESRLLTREMLYTAITRAQQRLTVVGTRESVRLAVESPVRRSSGLARRVSTAPGPAEKPSRE